MPDRYIQNEDTGKWYPVETIYIPFMYFSKLSIDGVEHDLTSLDDGCLGIFEVFSSRESAKKAYPDCDIIGLKTIVDGYFGD